MLRYYILTDFGSSYPLGACAFAFNSPHIRIAKVKAVRTILIIGKCGALITVYWFSIRLYIYLKTDKGVSSKKLLSNLKLAVHEVATTVII